MTDLRRTPVPGIFRGLRMFVFAYSIALTLFGFFSVDGVKEHYLHLLLFAVSYAAVFACVEIIRSKLILSAIIIGCTALDLLLLPNLPLGLHTDYFLSFIPYLVCIAGLPVTAVAYRVRMLKINFGSSALPAHMVILVAISLISGIIGDRFIALLLYYAALSYIPLSIANIFSESIGDTLDRMRGKTTQPRALFQIRMTGYSALIVFGLCTFLLLLPVVDFSEMIRQAAEYAFYWFKRLIAFLGDHKYIPPMDITHPHSSKSKNDIQGPVVQVPAIFGKICVTTACIVGLELLRRIIFTAIEKTVEFFRLAPKPYTFPPSSRSKYDTVERLEKARTDRHREKLTPKQSNAHKVRHIYRKKVARIFRDDLDTLFSKSPDEIVLIASEKGFDISELTEIYKKARYSDACTSADVTAAHKTTPIRI